MITTYQDYMYISCYVMFCILFLHDISYRKKKRTSHYTVLLKRHAHNK